MEREEFLRVRGEFVALSEQLTKAFLKKTKPVRAPFPRGFIRPLSDLMPRWPYLDAERRRTVACMLQLCDVVRWNLNMWDIGLTAGSMWEWHCTLPVVVVIETLLRQYGLQKDLITRKDRFKATIEKLAQAGVLHEQLRAQLQLLRQYRNHVHLHLVDKVELSDGRPRRYNEAVMALRGIEEALAEHAGLHRTRLASGPNRTQPA